MAKKWIKAAVGAGKGDLHRHLGIPQGEKIPAGDLEKAEHSTNPTIRREADLAETLKGFHHPKRARRAMYGSKE